MESVEGQLKESSLFIFRQQNGESATVFGTSGGIRCDSLR